MNNIFNRIQYIIRASINSILPENIFESRKSGKNASERQKPEFNSASPHTSGLKKVKPDPRLQSCYAMLEIPYGSSLEQSRSAWKRLLKKYHPDLFSSNPEKARIAEEISQELNLAFEDIRSAITEKRI